MIEEFTNRLSKDSDESEESLRLTPQEIKESLTESEALRASAESLHTMLVEAEKLEKSLQFAGVSSSDAEKLMKGIDEAVEVIVLRLFPDEEKKEESVEQVVSPHVERVRQELEYLMERLAQIGFIKNNEEDRGATGRRLIGVLERLSEASDEYARVITCSTVDGRGNKHSDESSVVSREIAEELVRAVNDISDGAVYAEVKQGFKNIDSPWCIVVRLRSPEELKRHDEKQESWRQRGDGAPQSFSEDAPVQTDMPDVPGSPLEKYQVEAPKPPRIPPDVVERGLEMQERMNVLRDAKDLKGIIAALQMLDRFGQTIPSVIDGRPVTHQPMAFLRAINAMVQSISDGDYTRAIAEHINKITSQLNLRNRVREEIYRMIGYAEKLRRDDVDLYDIREHIDILAKMGFVFYEEDDIEHLIPFSAQKVNETLNAMMSVDTETFKELATLLPSTFDIDAKAYMKLISARSDWSENQKELMRRRPPGVIASRAWRYSD